MIKYYFKLGVEKYEFSLSLHKFYDEDERHKFTRLQLRLPLVGQILLHKFYISDPEVCHNHPWDFFSLVLSKEPFVEEVLQIKYENSMSPEVIKTILYHQRFSFRFHPAKKYHRVIATSTPVWTLVFTGPRKYKNWGYYLEGTGHIDWQIYLQSEDTHFTGKRS
jgi:hypothetical protein